MNIFNQICGSCKLPNYTHQRCEICKKIFCWDHLCSCEKCNRTMCEKEYKSNVRLCSHCLHGVEDETHPWRIEGEDYDSYGERLSNCRNRIRHLLYP